jgi:hypothetical protein
MTSHALRYGKAEALHVQRPDPEPCLLRAAAGLQRAATQPSALSTAGWINRPKKETTITDMLRTRSPNPSDHVFQSD